MSFRRPGSIKSRKDRQNQQLETIDLSSKEPNQLPAIDMSHIKNLILNNNNIGEFHLGACFENLQTIELRSNNLTKFTLYCPNEACSFSLQKVDVSDNRLEFLNLTELHKLQQLKCPRNELMTVVLPGCIVEVDASENKLTNLRHHLLNNRVYVKLRKLIVCKNQILDVKLKVKGRLQCPYLQVLDCSENKVCQLQGLPLTLTHLHLSQNELLFNRTIVNEIMKLQKLVLLDTRANQIDQQAKVMIQSRIQGITILSDDPEPSDEDSFSMKESPYKLFMAQTKKIKNQHIFTLGDYEPDSDTQSGVTVEKEGKPSKQLQNKEVIKPNKHPKKQAEKEKYNLTVKEEEALLYHNHYCFYFENLLACSLIPNHPILQKNRSIPQSCRIDRQVDVENEFTLVNEMMKARGGIHYLRKVFQLKNTPVPPGEGWKSRQKMMFINRDFTKNQFEELCNGNYGLLSNLEPEVKFVLGPQPSCFTTYHVLLRFDPHTLDVAINWGCMYLIQSQHL